MTYTKEEAEAIVKQFKALPKEKLILQHKMIESVIRERNFKCRVQINMEITPEEGATDV